MILVSTHLLLLRIMYGLVLIVLFLKVLLFQRIVWSLPLLCSFCHPPNSLISGNPARVALKSFPKMSKQSTAVLTYLLYYYPLGGVYTATEALISWLPRNFVVYTRSFDTSQKPFSRVQLKAAKSKFGHVIYSPFPYLMH